MNNILRRRVSQNRKRYTEDHFDLDLTYINDSIIAMGYPSDKPIQSLIRNPIEEVSKFLNKKHKSEYKIFNLCQESDYDFNYFDNMVEIIKLEDHNPPKFEQILYFCEKVDEWINEKPKNVAVIHCKAGKGRTGTMICNYFLYTKKFSSAFDAMDEFNKIRCKDQKGVTIPSQRRYIEYYSDYLNNNRVYQSVGLNLKSIRIPNAKQYYSGISFQIICREDLKKIYDSKNLASDQEDFLFETEDVITLKDDIKVNFFNKKKELRFTLSFNTFFILNQEDKCSIEPSCLGSKSTNDKQIEYKVQKRDIDILSKNKNVNEDFKIIFKFDTVTNENESINIDTHQKIDLKRQQSVPLKNNTKSTRNKFNFLEFFSKFKLKRSVSETILYNNTEAVIENESRTNPATPPLSISNFDLNQIKD